MYDESWNDYEHKLYMRPADEVVDEEEEDDEVFIDEDEEDEDDDDTDTIELPDDEPNNVDD